MCQNNNSQFAFHQNLHKFYEVEVHYIEDKDNSSILLYLALGFYNSDLCKSGFFDSVHRGLLQMNSHCCQI